MTEEKKDLTKRKPLGLSLGGGASGQKTEESIRQSLSRGRSKTVTVEVKRRRFQPKVSEEETSSKLTTAEQNIRLKAVQEALQKETSAQRAQEIFSSSSERLLHQESEDSSSKTPPTSESFSPSPSQEDFKVSSESSSSVMLEELSASTELESQNGRLKNTSSLGNKENSRRNVEDFSVQTLTVEPVSSVPVSKTPVGPKGRQGTDSFSSRKTSAPKTDGRSEIGKRAGDEEEEKKRRFKKKGTPQRGVPGENTIEEEAHAGTGVFSHPTLGLKKLRKSSKKHIVSKTRRLVVLSQSLSIAELADKMSVKVSEINKLMGKMGMSLSDEEVDVETAELLAHEMGHEVLVHENKDPEEILWNKKGSGPLLERPPVVTIVGHVDHGKTSLLDALRKTNVVSGEAGGITQHIGAYQVVAPSGQRITFIDTPGHEAFTHMRARGVKATDIVVLVVAADDRVNAQTVEAIQHARSGEVPMVVAINKMDKPGAKPDQIRHQLLSEEVVVEKLGGDVLDVEISALTGHNLDKLEAAILLQAEVLELKAEEKMEARGLVLETNIKKGYGPVGTILIQRGTLRKGDFFVCGKTWGRVRILMGEKSQILKEATPSVPVEISGFQEPPSPGDRFIVVSSESEAKEVLEWKKQHAVSVVSENILGTSLEDHLKFSKIKELPIVVKADTQGSLEGLQYELNKITHEEVSTKVIFKGLGAITESDILLAKASKAIVLGFNVSFLPGVNKSAEFEGVTVILQRVIYHAIDDVKKVLSGLLKPEYQEVILGRGEVIQIFTNKKEVIAGCSVKEGLLRRGERINVLRKNKIVYEGSIKSLRHIKDDMKEVKAGYECGVSTSFLDFQVGDVLVCFKLVERQRTLSET